MRKQIELLTHQHLKNLPSNVRLIGAVLQEVTNLHEVHGYGDVTRLNEFIFVIESLAETQARAFKELGGYVSGQKVFDVL